MHRKLWDLGMRRDDLAQRARSTIEPPIECQERATELLGEGYVPSVMTRQIGSQRPNSLREWREREQPEIESQQGAEIRRCFKT